MHNLTKPDTTPIHTRVHAARSDALTTASMAAHEARSATAAAMADLTALVSKEGTG